MKADQEKTIQAIEAVERICAKCETHTDTCYVAVAKRSLLTLLGKRESQGVKKEFV